MARKTKPFCGWNVFDQKWTRYVFTNMMYNTSCVGSSILAALVHWFSFVHCSLCWSQTKYFSFYQKLNRTQSILVMLLLLLLPQTSFYWLQSSLWLNPVAVLCRSCLVLLLLLLLLFLHLLNVNLCSIKG